MKTNSNHQKTGIAKEKHILDIFHNLMNRYLNGEHLNDEELKLLDRVVLVDEADEDTEEFDLAEANQAQETIWNNIHSGLGKKITKANLKRNHRNPFIIHKYNIAAILVIGIGLGIFTEYKKISWRNELPEEYMALHKPERIVLPDSSVIYLHTGSKLTYKKNNFNKKNREVMLDGEAFFEVAGNPEKPFIVHGGETVTTVLGTSFNVKAYTGVKENVISVRDGKVEVKNNRQQPLGVLTGNLQLTWNIAKQSATCDTIDWQNAAGWINGKMLVLNSAGLDEIKMKMEHIYHITVNVEAVHELHINLCGTYPPDDNGKALLQHINDIYQIKNKHHNNEVILYR